MNEQPAIAIIGGGFTGALTAYHLSRHAVPARVVVVDPGSHLGLGLAYSTPSFRHLLNVPAARMTAIPGEPSHFVSWLRTNWSPNVTGEEFIPRAVFGQYIQSIVSKANGIEHLRTTAINCVVDDLGATLRLANGDSLRVDAVVLATGNFEPPRLRGVSEEAARSGIYRHSAWAEATFADLAPDAPVTLIGTGLTAVDVLLRLRERGHYGTVTAISRHGIFPNRHADYEPLATSVVPATAPRKTRELLHLMHRALNQGLPWRAVVDSLRPQTNRIWLSLSLEEQRRFQRHLQRRWDVVRHRMAPEIANHLEREITGGTLVKVRGSVRAVLPGKPGARVILSAGGATSEVASARVINCTGPNMNYRQVGSPLLDSLFTQGLIVEGPLGAGLASDEHGAVRSKDGCPSRILFNAGPGRQGMLLESIAVPELREHAANLANLLAARFRRQPVRKSILSGFITDSRRGAITDYESGKPELTPAGN